MVDSDLISEVKKKKEFSKLPDSVVERALSLNEESVKEARAFLRKYFGVFLTNKVVKGKDEKVLESHISSKGRDYEEFYGKIFEKKKIIGSVIDFGCGVNGFSYNVLKEFVGDVDYIGVEASGQIVENVNSYFDDEGLEKSCSVVWGDLFDLQSMKKIVEKSSKPRTIFLFQTVDALESFERDFSKKFLLMLKDVLDKDDKIIISLSLKSISGRRKFMVDRKWILEFLKENFNLEMDFVVGSERVLIVRV